MSRNPKDWFLVQKWRQYKHSWAPYMDSNVPAPELTVRMRQASIPSVSFFLMLAFATIIATLGLIANSAPAIIGAMIIAPLMAPIVSFSYGLVAFEGRLTIRSIVTVIAGVIMVVVLAYLIMLIAGLRITGSEILNRTSPNLIDLGVAMVAGAAAAFANTRQSIVSSIAGVAIAVALVPPLAVSGIGLALGEKATGAAGLSLTEAGIFSGGEDIASGAFMLFVTNFIGIVAFAMLVFIVQRYGHWKKAFIALVLFVGLTAVLTEPLGTAFHRVYVKHRVLRLVAKLSHLRPDIVSGRAKIDSINVTYRDDLLHVNLDGFFPKDWFLDESSMANLQKRVDRFEDYLAADIGEPVVVEFDVMVVDMKHVNSRRPEPETAEQQADN